MNMRLTENNITTPFATPGFQASSRPKLLDRINSLIAKIIAYFTQSKAETQSDLPLLEIKDPFAKLMRIQKQLSSSNPNLEDCLAELAEIEEALPTFEKRDKTDRCIASTVEMLFIKPQDTHKARFAKAREHMQERAHILLEGQEKKGRKSRFNLAQEAIEGQATALVCRQNFLSSQQTLRELGPELLQRKEKLAKAEAAKAKRFTKAKAHLEKRGKRLLSTQKKRMEAAALGPLIKEITYSTIDSAQKSYRTAKRRIYSLQRKTSVAEAEVEILRCQVDFLKSQSLTEQAQAGIEGLKSKAELLKLKILASTTSSKADQAIQDLKAYANAPKAMTNAEKRNSRFDAIQAYAAKEHNSIFKEFKKEIEARDLPEEEKQKIISKQKQVLRSSLKSIRTYAENVAQNQLVEMTGQERLVKVSQRTLEAHLKQRKIALIEARASQERALGYIALEGKSANDLKRGKAAYIGDEFTALSTIKGQIKEVKKFDRQLAKYLMQTPVLDIDIK